MTMCKRVDAQSTQAELHKTTGIDSNQEQQRQRTAKTGAIVYYLVTKPNISASLSRTRIARRTIRVIDERLLDEAAIAIDDHRY